VKVLQSFSLLFLGATLSTLATLNFSLAFVLGVLASPLVFIRPIPSLPPPSSVVSMDDAQVYLHRLAISFPALVLYAACSPSVVLYMLNGYFIGDIAWTLSEMAKGWVAQGVWTSLAIWGIWWPAWVVGGTVLFSGAIGPSP
jgi:GPI-anchor transamidase subunit GAA1